MKRLFRRLFHRHKWVERDVLGIPFRYCPECGKLQRKFPFWRTYPKKREGYRRIIEDFFKDESRKEVNSL